MLASIKPTKTMINSGFHDTIRHEGTVKQVHENSVLVSIIANSACSGCHAAGVCSLSGKKEKTVEVNGRYNVSPGEQVTVEMQGSMGMKAVILSYIVPFLIIVAGLVGFSSMSFSEPVAGLISLSLLVPYFLILYVFRNNINRSFSFTLKT